MLFKIITVALLGFSLGGVDAAGFVYQTYTSIGQDYLNTAVPIKLNAVAYQSNAANCRYECDLVETCVGAIFCESSHKTRVLFKTPEFVKLKP